MKRRLSVILAVVVLLGLGIAVAAGGSGTDPLVSKSYLENTYFADLGEILQKRAAQGTKGVYETAMSKLEELGEADVKAAQTLQAQGSAYLRRELKAGDSLELETGGSVLLFEGSNTLTAGTLADVTAGTSLRQGNSLTPAHRYIATSTATLRQTRDGSLGYLGAGVLQEGDEKALPFTDVGEKDWYYAAVSFAYNRGYFSGTGETTFSPNASMTRAMVATVLHRMAGSESVAEPARFSDVPDGQWHSQGIAWASQKGIVNGMGDDRYAPEAPVTREQLVTMFYRYEKEYAKTDVSAVGDLGTFPDGEQVSPWAREALTWAAGTGLLTGRDTGHLDPAGTATRAEVATILQRFAVLEEKS